MAQFQRGHSKKKRGPLDSVLPDIFFSSCRKIAKNIRFCLLIILRRFFLLFVFSLTHGFLSIIGSNLWSKSKEWSRIKFQPQALDYLSSILDSSTEPAFQLQDLMERVFEMENADLAARILGKKHKCCKEKKS